MKARNIFKIMTCALAVPAMLLTTACSSDEDLKVEQVPTSSKGYAYPVTINVNRSAGDVTRTNYNESTKKLEFTKGDKLFYSEYDGGGAGRYALLLDYQSGSSFSGTLYTQNEYTGSVTDLLKKGRGEAMLLPAGYEAIGFLVQNGEEGWNMNFYPDNKHAFAPSKKLAIEQLSMEMATNFDEVEGFKLTAYNGIFCCTVTGLEPNKTYNFTLRRKDNKGAIFDISGASISDDTGKAEFAVGTTSVSKLDEYTVIIDNGAKYMDIEFGNKYIKRAHIISADREATAKKEVDLSELPISTFLADHGDVLTGTLPDGIDIQIADGASVVLKDATINSTVAAGITCLGDATIILEGENTVSGTGAGIQAGPAGKTLTIVGKGTLTVQGAENCAGIGTGNGGTCGDITISGGTIKATGGENAAGIGTGAGATCGKILIEGGTVEATGTGYGAAIGTGNDGTCGNIVFTKDVTSVFAKKGGFAPHSIGKGSEGSIIGEVSLGGDEGAISTSPYKYPATKVETWYFFDTHYMNLAAGKTYEPLTIGVDLWSNGLSGGTITDGHWEGVFRFLAPYNRAFTSIIITCTCNSVSRSGWTKTATGAEWTGSGSASDRDIYIECDLEDVEKIVFNYQ